MKLYSNLEATEENIAKTYEEDLLCRKESVDNFAKYLRSEFCPPSVAINGEWGSGKTFFVKQTAHLLELEKFNDNNPQKILTIYYDAWENDNNCDPILSIIDCIARKAGNGDSSKLLELGKIALNIADALIGNPVLKGLKVLCESKILSESDINTNSSNDQIKLKLKELYDEILNENADRLIIFIDELDRCKPDFSIKVLERIKHYINIDERVQVVFSINKNQLEHSVNKCYGSNFDSCNYLNRFFDLIFDLPEVDTSLYIFRNTGRNPDMDMLNLSGAAICSVVDYFHIPLRDINKYLSALDSVYERTRFSKNKDNDTYSFIFFTRLLPLILAIKFVDKNKYNMLISGEGSNLIENFWDNYQPNSTFEISTDLELYDLLFCSNNDSLNITNHDLKIEFLNYLNNPFGI